MEVHRPLQCQNAYVIRQVVHLASSGEQIVNLYICTHLQYLQLAPEIICKLVILMQIRRISFHENFISIRPSA